MTTTFDFGAIEDGLAWVAADVLGGRVFAAGVTVDVSAQTELVVPLARDFLEGSFPATTCRIASGEHLLRSGMSRLRITVKGEVWRPGADFGSAKNLLLEDLAKLFDGYAAHAKAHLVARGLQSAEITTWTGPGPRLVGTTEAPQLFLTLPYELEVVVQAIVEFQPA